ncbi:hypothetical protein ACC668_37635, partial [Rhizobium ruizarguesonis]
SAIHEIPRVGPPDLQGSIRDPKPQRSYPGNIRDLQQVIARMMYRCEEDGTISIGYVARNERPADVTKLQDWLDDNFETLIQRAVL